MEIMRKDIQHMQRMEDMKRKVEVENSMRAKAREQRFQNAKVKRYFEEFRLQQRAKMLKKTTREELIFKNLFNESLKIQKERMLDLKRYAKEKAELSQKQQLNQISSIESFYKNKFDLLNEKLANEKKNGRIFFFLLSGVGSIQGNSIPQPMGFKKCWKIFLTEGV